MKARNRRRYWLPLLLSGVLSVPLAAQSDQSPGSPSPIQYTVSYAKRVPADASINSVLRLPASAFQIEPDRAVSAGIVDRPVWLRIAMERPDPGQSLILDPGLAPPTRIDLYVVQPALAGGAAEPEARIGLHAKAGRLVPLDRWPLPLARPVFALPSSDSARGEHDSRGPETWTIFLRVEALLPLNVPVTIQTMRQFRAHREYERTLSGIYYGVSLFLTLYLVYLALKLRSGLYWYALAFIAGHAGLHTYMDGTLHALLATQSGDPAPAVLYAGLNLAMIGLNLFFERLFRIRQTYPRFGRVIVGMSAIFVLQAALYLIQTGPFGPHTLFRAFMLTSFVDGALLLIFAIFIAARRKGAARMIVSIYILSQAMALLYNLHISGVLAQIGLDLFSGSSLRLSLHATALVPGIVLYGFFFAATFAERRNLLHAPDARRPDERTRHEPTAETREPPPTGVSDPSPRSEFDPDEVESLRARIHTLFEQERIHHDENLSLRTLAKSLGLRPYRLSDFLAAHMGLSFWELLTGYRTRDAAKLLVDEPNRTILSAAFAVGFDSKSAFNRAFRRQFGTTPRAYREMYVASRTRS